MSFAKRPSRYDDDSEVIWIALGLVLVAVALSYFCGG